MSDLEMWSLIVGAASPPLIAILQQPHWSAPTRAVLTAAWCIVLGLGTAWQQGQLTGRTGTSAVLGVLVAALATYQSLWKPLGIAPAIEAATSRDASHDVETG